ncbi:MAG: TRAP transporter substrate-binding protein [Anaerotignaceae bacterium]
MKKRVLSVLLATTLLLSISISGCGSSSATTETTTLTETSETTEIQVEGVQGEYAIRVGHVLAQVHPYQLGLEKFGEILSEKTNGQAVVDVFHSSTLGNERDMVEALQLGTQEMVLVSTAVLSSFTDKFLVFDLPFLFQTTEEARMVCDSDLGQEILTSVDKEGLKGLIFFENGFRNVTNSKLLIEKPEDLKGLKIRTMESPIHMAAFRAMGADPTPMAMGELFTALQQKTIDGQENPLAIIDSSKLYEVQEYISLTGHFYAPAPLFIANDYYESMPADIQEAVLEAAKQAQVYEREVLDEMNKELVTKLTDVGCTVTEVDKAPFIEAVQSVYTDWIGEGDGLVEPAIYEQVMEMLK